jgi:hypothetical protein
MKAEIIYVRISASCVSVTCQSFACLSVGPQSGLDPAVLLQKHAAQADALAAAGATPEDAARRAALKKRSDSLVSPTHYLLNLKALYTYCVAASGYVKLSAIIVICQSDSQMVSRSVGQSIRQSDSQTVRQPMFVFQ